MKVGKWRRTKLGLEKSYRVEVIVILVTLLLLGLSRFWLVEEVETELSTEDYGSEVVIVKASTQPPQTDSTDVVSQQVTQPEDALPLSEAEKRSDDNESRSSLRGAKVESEQAQGSETRISEPKPKEELPDAESESAVAPSEEDSAETPVSEPKPEEELPDAESKSVVASSEEDSSETSEEELPDAESESTVASSEKDSSETASIQEQEPSVDSISDEKDIDSS